MTTKAPEHMISWIRDAWAEAVELSTYRPGKGAMCRVYKGQLYHCPLGVLCELAIQTNVISHGYWCGDENSVQVMAYEGEQGILPFAVMEWSGLKQRVPHVNPTVEQRIAWDLPKRYLPKLRGIHVPAVPLSAVADYTQATPREIAALIRTL